MQHQIGLYYVLARITRLAQITQSKSTSKKMNFKKNWTEKKMNFKKYWTEKKMNFKKYWTEKKNELQKILNWKKNELQKILNWKKLTSKNIEVKNFEIVKWRTWATIYMFLSENASTSQGSLLISLLHLLINLSHITYISSKVTTQTKQKKWACICKLTQSQMYSE